MHVHAFTGLAAFADTAAAGDVAAAVKTADKPGVLCMCVCCVSMLFMHVFVCVYVCVRACLCVCVCLFVVCVHAFTKLAAFADTAAAGAKTADKPGVCVLCVSLLFMCACLCVRMFVCVLM